MGCCSNTVHFLGFMKYMQGVVTFSAHTPPLSVNEAPFRKCLKSSSECFHFCVEGSWILNCFYLGSFFFLYPLVCMYV